MKRFLNIIRTIITFGLPTKLFAFLALGGLVRALVPLYRLCAYSIPYYDDYSSAAASMAYMQTPSDWQGLLVGAVQGAKGNWYAWEGLFAAKFLQGLDPLVFGEQYQFLGPVLVLTVFVVGIFVLFYAILHTVFHASWDVTLGVSSLAATQLVLFLYTPQQGIYWYNGAVKYIGISGLSMMFAATFLFLAVSRHTGTRLLHAILGSLLGIAAGAGNFITGVHMILFVAAFWVVYLLLRKRNVGLIPSDQGKGSGRSGAGSNGAAQASMRTNENSLGAASWNKNRRRSVRPMASPAWFLPQTIVFAVSFIVAAVAPGNAKRAAWYAGMGMAPWKAILSSFPEGVKFLPQFLDMRTLLFLLLYLPFLVKLVGETDRKRWFRLPGVLLAVAFSVCFYAAGFAPNLYSEGQVVLSRVINCIKIGQQLMMLLDLTFVLGWLACGIAGVREKIAAGNPRARILQEPLQAEQGKGITGSLRDARVGTSTEEETRHTVRENREKMVRLSWCGSSHILTRYIWWVLVLWLFAWNYELRIQPNPIGTYSSWGAEYYLETGQADMFRQEYLVRVEVLHSGEQDVVLKPYTVMPWFLGWADISTDPGSEANQFMAQFYGISSVRLGE